MMTFLNIYEKITYQGSRGKESEHLFAHSTAENSSFMGKGWTARL
jgi:hypothetical protein